MEVTEIEDKRIAVNTSKKDLPLAVLTVTVDGSEVWYEAVSTPCTCPDRKYLHGHLSGKRNHFYSECEAHGLQDCGSAIRQQRATAANDPDRTHRRRTSGANTSAWYTKRGK